MRNRNTKAHFTKLYRAGNIFHVQKKKNRHYTIFLKKIRTSNVTKKKEKEIKKNSHSKLGTLV